MDNRGCVDGRRVGRVIATGEGFERTLYTYQEALRQWGTADVRKIDELVSARALSATAGNVGKRADVVDVAGVGTGVVVETSW